MIVCACKKIYLIFKICKFYNDVKSNQIKTKQIIRDIIKVAK